MEKQLQQGMQNVFVALFRVTGCHRKYVKIDSVLRFYSTVWKITKFTLKTIATMSWIVLVGIAYLTIFMLDIFAGASSGENEQQRFYFNPTQEDE